MSTSQSGARQEQASTATAPPAEPQLNPGDDAAPGTPSTGEGEALCPQCGGSGRIRSGACPTCGGSGRVVKAVGGA